MKYVIKEGRLKATVSPASLIYSSWLKSAKAYTIENTIVVIAEIRRDDYGFNTKKYIFCGISAGNWNAFYWGLSDTNKSIGERFHIYIYKNKCNCLG